MASHSEWFSLQIELASLHAWFCQEAQGVETEVKFRGGANNEGAGRLPSLKPFELNHSENVASLEDKSFVVEAASLFQVIEAIPAVHPLDL